MSEITLDLRLEIKIPSSKLTINGLVLGVKEGASQVYAVLDSNCLHKTATLP